MLVGSRRFKMPKKEMEKCECRHDKSPFVAIPASLAGIFLVLTVLFLVFARDQLGLLVPLLWGFVVLGIVSLIASSRAERNRK